MNHWLLDKISEMRTAALREADRAVLYDALTDEHSAVDHALLGRAADALELAVLDILLQGKSSEDDAYTPLALAAADAFRLLRAQNLPNNALDAGRFTLRAAALAVLGDKTPDAARWLREHPWPSLPVQSTNWRERTWASIIEIWLLLVRKDGWSDRDAVLERISNLRSAQTTFEEQYLTSSAAGSAKAAALELIGLYHLAKAAEICAQYITDGVVDNKHQIHQLLDTHFDRALEVCKHAQLVDLEALSRILAAAASRMAGSMRSGWRAVLL